MERGCDLLICFLTFKIRAVRSHAFAGKPAPTGSVSYTNYAVGADHCGSGLAREGVLEVCTWLKPGEGGKGSEDFSRRHKLPINLR